MKLSGNTNQPERDTGGSGGLVRRYLGWALLGSFGIGVAVGIALVAGQLASQPVGITGEPVSATSSLASPPDKNPARSDRKARRKKDRAAARRQDGEGGSPVAAGSAAGAVASTSSGDSGASYGSSGSGSSGDSGSGKEYEYEDDSYDDSDYDDDYDDDYDYDYDDDYDDDD